MDALFMDHLIRLKAGCGYTKVCTTCKSPQLLTNFFRQPAGKHHITSECKVCTKVRRRAHYDVNKVAIIAQTLSWAAANPEKRVAYTRDWKLANPERQVEICRGVNARFRAKHPEKAAENDRKKRGRRALATTWGDCGPVYREAARATRAGVPHAVDHIFALQGETVSGLHVPDNLRSVTRRLNCQKGGKLPGFLAEMLWDASGPGVFHE